MVLPMVALLLTYLAPVFASCGNLDPCHHSRLRDALDENVNATPPATLAMLDPEAENQVFGPPTPTMHTLEGLDYQGPPMMPWREIDYVLELLWMDGREFTVYMILHYLRTRRDETPRDPAIESALLIAQPFDDGVTRISPPPCWANWVDDVLARWTMTFGDVEQGRPDEEEHVLMQQGTPATTRRPTLWTRYMEQLAEFPEAVRAVVFRGLAGWLRERLDSSGPALATFGGMLRDVSFDRVTMFRACSDEDRRVGTDMVTTMIEELKHAEAQGLLTQSESASRLGAATRDLAMDLSERSTRWATEAALPLEDAWGNSLKREETEVGLRVTQWLRSRLQSSGCNRVLLYQQVVKAIRAQVAQECRHLRRMPCSGGERTGGPADSDG